MSLARNGNTDIYDEPNYKIREVDKLPGIDTAPSYSRMGIITFESDRSGSQKIYVMNLKTKVKNWFWKG